MPVTTRRIGTISPLTWDFHSCCQQDFPSFSSDDFPFPSLVAFEFGAGEDVRSSWFKKFAPVTTSSNSMMETTRVSFRTLSSCLPLPAISHFPFNVGSIFLSTPCHYSMNHTVSGFEVPTCHLLVIKTISLMFLIFNNLFVLRFAPFLDHTEPTQSVTEQNPLILTSTILPGPFP